jgi:hypothetical protein
MIFIGMQEFKMIQGLLVDPVHDFISVLSDLFFIFRKIFLICIKS